MGRLDVRDLRCAATVRSSKLSLGLVRASSTQKDAVAVSTPSAESHRRPLRSYVDAIEQFGRTHDWNG
jgi:hypothetical protein